MVLTVPSAGNQTFGNLGSDERHSVQLNSQIWCFDQFPASVSTYCVCLSVGRRSWYVFSTTCRRTARMCWIFAQVPGFRQKEGSIFSGFALLGISWLSKPCVCADNSTTLVYIYIVTLSRNSRFWERVWTDQCNGMRLTVFVAELGTRKTNPAKIDAWNTRTPSWTGFSENRFTI